MAGEGRIFRRVDHPPLWEWPPHNFLNENQRMTKSSRRKAKRAAADKTGRAGGLYDHSAGGIRFSRQPMLLPSRMKVPMTYVDTVDLSSTVGALGHYEYAANGLFDPDITGGGHQPYGFDQWIGQFFTKALVTRANIEVKAVATAAPMGFGVTFARATPTATISTLTGLIETSRGSWAVSGGVHCPPQTVRSNFDLSITDPEYDPGSFWSTVAANPVFVYHFSIFAQSIDGASTSLLQGIVRIDYEVDLMDPVTIAQS